MEPNNKGRLSTAFVAKELVKAATELASESLNNPGWQPHPCTIFNVLAKKLKVSGEFEKSMARMPARLKAEIKRRRAEFL